MASHPSLLKNKSLSYFDAARLFNDKNVKADLTAASERLAQTLVALMGRFDAVTTQLHTIDLQKWAAPLKPRWHVIRKDFRELIWQCRTNAGCIAGRAKMFNTVVLPLAARNLNAASSRARDEKLQVVQSYMAISADHARLTRSLTENALRMSASLCAFHTDLAKLASQRGITGDRELRQLAYMISQLANHVEQICIANGKSTNLDVTHYTFSALRMIPSSGHKPGHSKLSHQRLVMHGADLSTIGKLSEQLDRTQNEVAHAHYAAQVSHCRSDVLTTTQTAISALVSEQMLALEPLLGLFLSTWSRLQGDCQDVLQWLYDPKSHPDPPSPIAAYVEGGQTIFTAVAHALDSFVAVIDPSHFVDKSI